MGAERLIAELGLLPHPEGGMVVEKDAGNKVLARRKLPIFDIVKD